MLVFNTVRPARRGVTLAVLAASASLGVFSSQGRAADAASPIAAGGVAAATPEHRTTVLERSHEVHSGPSEEASLLGRVSMLRPITHARTVLPVLDRTNDPSGHHWLRVLLPGRPNGRTGWIRGAGTSRDTTPWAIEVRRGRRTAVVRRNGAVVRTFRVIVGAPATPTPLGRFFVEEVVRIPNGRLAGPYALALSARSTVLQEFDGGPGQIALHGRDGLGGALGTAVSHGCLRLGRDTLRWLATRIGPGVRVTIRR